MFQIMTDLGGQIKSSSVVKASRASFLDSTIPKKTKKQRQSKSLHFVMSDQRGPNRLSVMKQRYTHTTWYSWRRSWRPCWEESRRRTWNRSRRRRWRVCWRTSRRRSWTKSRRRRWRLRWNNCRRLCRREGRRRRR